jgi:hypothetical protein
MGQFLSSEVPWAAILAVVIGLNLASWYACRVRLRDWAESVGVRIVKKEAALGIEAPKEISYRARRTGTAYRVVVQTPDQHSYTGWIDVGGLFAALLGRDPKVVWIGQSPVTKEPTQPPGPARGP